jgi:hypothetical protein
MFIVDHSSGHDCQCPDGLRVKGLNRVFGGMQAQMQDTLIEQVDRDLGKYKSDLKPGETQILVFPEDCPVEKGPWYMSKSERHAPQQNHTHPTETSKKI